MVSCARASMEVYKAEFAGYATKGSNFVEGRVANIVHFVHAGAKIFVRMKSPI